MESKENPKPKKYAAQALATWARLKTAGKAPGGKPLGAEVAKDNPDLKK